MGEFATLGGDSAVPGTGGSTNENALGLTNPDAVLTGTSRGQQALGAPNIKTDSANQRIIVNDNTTNRVSFGKIGTGINDWGLKVSKPTFSVDTATADQLIFNSAQNAFKIVTTATLVIPSFTLASAGVTNTYTGSAQSALQPHGFSYTPAVSAFFAGSGFYTPIPFIDVNAGGTGGGLQITWYHIYVDGTNVYGFGYSTAYGGFNWTGTVVPSRTIKYYLLQETAN